MDWASGIKSVTIARIVITEFVTSRISRRLTKISARCRTAAKIGTASNLALLVVSFVLMIVTNSFATELVGMPCPQDVLGNPMREQIAPKELERRLELHKAFLATLRATRAWNLEERLNLRCVDLSDLDLSGIDLSYALLEYADLRGTRLVGVKVLKAQFVGADLRGADLSGAFGSAVDLDRADLRETRLLGINLKGVRIWGTDFSGAEMREARLRASGGGGAKFVGTDLRFATLRGSFEKADLTGANLSHGDLSPVNLTSAVLKEANLRWADLEYSRMQFANLTSANLYGANLNRADLDGAQVKDANLVEATLEKAQLTTAVLSGALLRGARLRGAVLDGSDLTEADLRDANLSEASLRCATLRTQRTKPKCPLQTSVTSRVKDRERYALFSTLPDSEVCANLSNADLRGANLADADLYRASLFSADLRRTTLNGACLTGANLRSATLSGLDLRSAALGDTDLTGAKLRDSDLRRANLSKAILLLTDIGNAKLSGARLADTLWEPQTEPDFDYLRDLQGLSTVRFTRNQGANFQALRKALRDRGYRDLEREATFSLEANRTRHLLRASIVRDPYAEQPVQPEDRSEPFARLFSPQAPDTPPRYYVPTALERVEGVFRLVFIEWPVAYGLEPGRAIRSLLSLIVLMTAIYAAVLAFPTNQARLYLIRPVGRLLPVANGALPQIASDDVIEPLEALGWKAFALGFWFSLFSAFHFGWRDFNVGSWLSKVLPEDFALRGYGWVRTAGGFQSLLSLFFLAMWALFYFGRPLQ